MGRFGSTFFGELQFGQETTRFFRTSTVHSDGIFAGSDRILTLNRQAAAWAELLILESTREDIHTRQSQSYANALYGDATRSPIQKTRTGVVWSGNIRARSTGDLGLDRRTKTFAKSVRPTSDRAVSLRRSPTAYSVSSENTTNRTLTVPRTGETAVAALYADSTRKGFTKSRVASMFASPAQVISDRDQQLTPRQAETYVRTVFADASGALKLIRQSQLFLNGSWTQSDREFIIAEKAGDFGRNKFGGIRFGQKRTVRSGKLREPTTYSDPIQSVTSRKLNLPRAAEVFTELFRVQTDGYARKERLSNIFTNALVTEAVRSPLSYSRSTMTFVERAFTRATANLGLNRTARGILDPVYTNTTRVNSQQRDPVVHTPGVQAETGRRLSLNRLADVYLSPLLTNAERAGIAFNRAANTYLSSLIANTKRAVTKNRTLSTFVDKTSSDSTRQATLRADASSFASSFKADSTRSGIAFGREANVWVKTILSEAARNGISFSRVPNTYVQTIDTNVTDAKIAFTRTSNTFVKAMFRASDRKFVYYEDGQFGKAQFGSAIFGDEQVEYEGKTRGAETFVTVVETDSTRGLTLQADSSTFVKALKADAIRSRTTPRVGNVFHDRTMVRATGDLGLERRPTTVLDPVNTEYSGVLNLPRTTNTYVKPVSVEGDIYRLRRAASFMQTIESASERQLSLQALANVYSEMIVTEAGRTLSLDRAAATFMKALVANYGRVVEKPRKTVVHIEDIQTLADRVLERYRTSETFVSPIQMETDAGAPHWIINGRQVQELIKEVRTWNSMTLTFRSNKNTVKNRLRPLFDRPGKVNVVEEIDGGFNTVNRGGAGNELSTKAPFGRGKARPVDTWFVADYSEEVVGRDGTSWEVEVELTPDKEKSYDNEYGTLNQEHRESQTSNTWKFAFDYGDVVTRRVTTNVDRTPDGTVTGANVELVLAQDELRRLEESAGKLAATNLREVPDGADLMEDVTPNDRNTVTVTPPDGSEDTITPGEYVISEFETEYNRGAYVVTLTIKQT